MSKLVSVIIPTYARTTGLIRSIESVLNQDYKNIEIIVVDDNNPETQAREKVTEIMLKYSNIQNVIYLQHEANKNGSAARNTGFAFSSGKYIIFLDDDDYFEKSNISNQVNALDNSDSKIGGCYTDFSRKYPNGRVELSQENRSGNFLVDVLARNLLINAGSNVMYKREVLKEINGFDESFRRSQDLEILVRFFDKGYELLHVATRDLVIMMDSRDSSLTEVNNLKKLFESLTYFEDKFSDVENKLSIQSKQKIHSLRQLEKLKVCLLNKNVIKASRSVLGISPIVVIKYLFYLYNRKKMNVVKGFEFD